MLILVRHGRTGGNAAGQLQGRIDNPLDEVGRRQAEQVAAAIGHVDHVISSPLLRARQTAAMFDGALTIDDRWIELDYGELDGQPLADVPREVWATWRTDPHFAPAGGETMHALDARVRSAATEALEMARTGTVVVVSHVSPIKAAIAWALGGDVSMSWRCHLDQASVSRITPGPSGPVLKTFNETLYR
ncbi:MAG: phosphoglycerate mutase family protein [Ilumatobacteraceae bacterium]|nr:phosphoglycerate mutase family protein [Ilumatobacteraceae bacterium]